MKGLLSLVLGAVLLAFGSTASSAQELEVGRLAALPRLIGTAPSQPIWSSDGQRLAFLWNDDAMAFRDLWVVPAAGGEPRRVTRLAESEAQTLGPRPEPGSFEALQRAYEERSRRGVSEAVWEGDGESLVFLYRGHLFRVKPDGGDPERLTREPASRHALAVSPDGRILSYLQDADLYLWHRGQPEPVRATHAGVPPIGHLPGASFYAPDAGFMSYRWSPEGGFIALKYEDRRDVRKMIFPDYLGEETHVETLRRDLPGENDLVRTIAIYNVSTGRARTVDLPDPVYRRFGSFRFSPDGTSLLVDQFSEDGEHRWIYLVRSRDASFRVLRHDFKPEGGSTTSASSLWTSVWTSDGEGIIYISDVDGWFRLYSMPAAGGRAEALTSGEWSVVGSAFEGASLTLSPTTNEVFFVATKKSPYERQVYRMSEDGGPVVAVTSLPGTHRPFVSPDGKMVASLRSSDMSPTELYLVDARGGAERRVTNSPPKEFDQYAWIEPRYVTFGSRTDDATLHGRLIEPPNLDRTKKYPAIVGPVYSNTVRNRWTSSFDTFQQYMALERGYLVLLVDIRGSVGYGREFRSEFVGNVGEIDIEDLHSGVEYLESLSYVDPDRIGIWGWSYGGLLAAMSLFKKPGVYQAGVAGAPATNVWHATTGEVDLFYHPNARPKLYRKGSAFLFADGLQDPLMIIHGMQDTIVLFRDTIKLIEKLMLLEKDFEIVPLPSSVHSAQTRDYYTSHVFKKIAQHFDRHLGRGPSSTATRTR